MTEHGGERVLGRAMEAAHGRIDSHLARMRLLAAVGDPEARVAFETFRAALLHHMDIEEALLWPACEGRTPAACDVAVFRREHAGILAAVDRMGAALATHGEVDDRALEVLNLLCPHEDAEERFLVPLIEELLAEDERRRLAELLAGV